MDNFIRPTSQQYFNLFQQDPVGKVILEDLASRFYDVQTYNKDPYEHAFNAGKREVIMFILRRCSQSTTPEGEVNDNGSINYIDNGNN